jgi:histidine triad (HIT) family protein
MQPSVFTKIIRGELPSYKLLENEWILAILTLDPIQLGHTIVFPKIQVDHFAEVPEPHFSEIFKAAKVLCPAIQKASSCVRVGGIFVGLEVPHAHFHLVPLFDSSDIDFKKAKKRTEEEMKTVQQAILKNLSKA